MEDKRLELNEEKLAQVTGGTPIVATVDSYDQQIVAGGGGAPAVPELRGGVTDPGKTEE